MPRSAFSPSGVQEKLNELYLLSNTQLIQQADSIETDFKSWIVANFDLSVGQSTYLAQMNANTIKDYGYQTSLAVRNRLPITLVYPEPNPPGYAKWSVMNNNLIISANGSGSQTVTGSLNFTMEYRPA